MKALLAIQAELKCPKNLTNTFGNYRYRNAEGILEAVKPLLTKHNCILTLSDEIIQVGNHNYICATACLIDDKGNSITVTANAREPETKKGMDDSQITGAASSYARKYALNGLLAIDDTKDADSMDNRHEGDFSQAFADYERNLSECHDLADLESAGKAWSATIKKWDANTQATARQTYKHYQTKLGKAAA